MGVATALAGCGRVGFDTSADASSPADADTRSYSERVLASGPYAYYRLAETTLGVAADATGQGHDGQYILGGGTIMLARPGALTAGSDVAVRFDGDESGPTYGASMELVTDPAVWDADFSVELFALPHVPPPAGYAALLFVCESYLVDGFRFGWAIDGQLEVWTTEAGGSGYLTSASGTLSYTEWNHLVLVRAAGGVTLYRDAVPVASGVVDYVPASAAAASGIGSFHGLPSHATFDELALYDRALSRAEIESHLAGR